MKITFDSQDGSTLTNLSQEDALALLMRLRWSEYDDYEPEPKEAETIQ